jgi:citrate lyase subunit beta/citryl-CoA lyase
MTIDRPSRAGRESPPASGPVGPAMLFCPGERPDRFEKALAAADTLLIDLEDAVAVGNKDTAREMVRTALKDLPPQRTVVRINPPRSEAGAADLAMARASNLRFVMIPKVEDAADIASAAPFSVIALCETAYGVQHAPAIAAAPGCVGLMWGGEDLTADVGGVRSRGLDGAYLPLVQYARSRVLIAAAAARIPAWDGVYLDIADLKGLQGECAEAVFMGFAAKAAIHPSQAAVIRDAYRPSAEQLDWARRVVEAVRTATSGVVSLDGQMIDGPLVAMAERTIAADRKRTEN